MKRTKFTISICLIGLIIGYLELREYAYSEVHFEVFNKDNIQPSGMMVLRQQEGFIKRLSFLFDYRKMYIRLNGHDLAIIAERPSNDVYLFDISKELNFKELLRPGVNTVSFAFKKSQTYFRKCGQISIRVAHNWEKQLMLTQLSEEAVVKIYRDNRLQKVLTGQEFKVSQSLMDYEIISKQEDGSGIIELVLAEP